MIQRQTCLDVADNSGARRIMCIGIIGGSKKKYAHIGDIIVASVKETIPQVSLKPGTVTKAVIVRTKKHIKREDGSYIKFDDNSAVLLDDAGNPRGTRVFGPIPRELRKKGFTKIITLAPEVV